MSNYELKKLAWIKDKEDMRDKTHVSYLRLQTDIPESKDLSSLFTPVEDQGDLGSCTSNAAAGIVEFFERNVLGRYTNLSRLFTYKVTRNLEKSKGDIGATIRGTLGSLRLFGACPETYLKYNVSKFDEEPTAFQYAFASNYKAIDYYRLDLEDSTALIDKIKTHIATNVPVICGIQVYDNFYDNADGNIDMPTGSLLGGHAIVLCGYNKDRIIFRNSWGSDWGTNGYGSLPIEYVNLYGSDFWVLLKSDYVSISKFL